MARTTAQTAQKPTPSFNVDAFVEALYSRDEKAVASKSGSLLQRSFQTAGDVLSDSRDLFGCLAEGWNAGKANYHVVREIERNRQMARTKQRLAALLEQ